MNIQKQERSLTISGLRELGAANAHAFHEEVFASLDEDLTTIEIDLSQLSFVDSGGLGALVSLHKSANRLSENPVIVRLIDPSPAVRQLLELTRMHCLFEIVRSSAPAGSTLPSPPS